MFKNVGLFLSFAACAIGGYEALAILVDPVPTISRLTQGLRDGGHTFLVFMISQVIGWIFMSFAMWLYYHLNHQIRSTL